MSYHPFQETNCTLSPLTLSVLMMISFIPKELGSLGWHRSHSARFGRTTRHIPLHNAALRYNYFCNIVIYVA